jgi:hypothetical protein
MPDNTYGFSLRFDYFGIAENKHSIDWPSGAVKPTWNGQGDVYGCGLLLSSDNELSISFTGNGLLIGNNSEGRIGAKNIGRSH